MLFIVPIHRRLDWRNPPWVTLVLILVNVFIFFGVQDDDTELRRDAVKYYYESGLAEIEYPRYIDWLYQQNRSLKAGRLEAFQGTDESFRILVAIQQDRDFRQALSANRVIRDGEPAFSDWRRKRDEFERRWQRPVTERYAFEPGEPSSITWLTSMFLHGGVGHLLGNMLVLLLVGMLVEGALGPVRYAVSYVLGGIAAILLYAAAHWGGGQGVIGASGAIAGLMGMYTVIFGLRRIRFFYNVLFWFDYVKAPAIVLLPLWVGNELFQLWTQGSGRVAYTAHLGGLLGGAGIGGWFRWRGTLDHDFLDRESNEERDRADYQRAMDQLGALRFESAVSLLRGLSERNPGERRYLTQWYKAARHDPDGDDFHRAARRVLHLEGFDRATLALIRDTWNDYRKACRGRVRLPDSDLVKLARRLACNGMPEEARPIVQALAKKQPDRPELAGLFTDLARAFLNAGNETQARAFTRIVLSGFPDSEAGKEARIIHDRLGRSDTSTPN